MAGRPIPALPVLSAPAACNDPGVDPDLFFRAAEVDQAAELCRRCPVLDECAAFARTVPVYGVWAGTTPEQRARSARSEGRRYQLVLTAPYAGPEGVRDREAVPA